MTTLRKDVPIGVVYAPNSIHHGYKLHSNSEADRAVNLNIAYNRLVDFLEFLFDHSEHCNHITQRDAWNEFERWEIRQIKEEKKLKLKKHS